MARDQRARLRWRLQHRARLRPRRGRTKTGRLWTAVRDERPYGSPAPPAAFYLYSPDRKAEHARALLKGCRGHLHADAYAGFAGLYEADAPTGAAAPLTEVACWAHARREIYDVHVETKSLAAAQALEMNRPAVCDRDRRQGQAARRTPQRGCGSH
jgi:transposase